MTALSSSSSLVRDDLVFANAVGKPAVPTSSPPGRLEIARDNMGHAGGTGSITLDVYSKSWWEERVETVTRVVEAVKTEPDEKSEESNNAAAPKPLRQGANGELWEPYWEPQGVKPDQN